ncbi:MAG: hypothetical protein ACYC9Q_09240 [Bacillota bacterium]
MTPHAHDSFSPGLVSSAGPALRERLKKLGLAKKLIRLRTADGRTSSVFCVSGDSRFISDVAFCQLDRDQSEIHFYGKGGGLMAVPPDVLLFQPNHSMIA